MAKVVVLTAMAGDGIDLQCGDVFETDDATAARLIEVGAATAFTNDKPPEAIKKQEPPRVLEAEPGEVEDDESDADPDGTINEQPIRRPTRRR